MTIQPITIITFLPPLDWPEPSCLVTQTILCTELSVTNLKTRKLGCLMQNKNFFLFIHNLCAEHDSKNWHNKLGLSRLLLLILWILKNVLSSVQDRTLDRICYSFLLTFYLLTINSTTFDGTQWFITAFTSACHSMRIMALCVITKYETWYTTVRFEVLIVLFLMQVSWDKMLCY